MRRVLHYGPQAFEILECYEDQAGIPVMEFHDDFFAFGFLRQFMFDRFNMGALRDLLAREFNYMDLSRLHDSDVIEQLAWRLRAGLFKVLRLTPFVVPIGGLGTTQEDAQEKEPVPERVPLAPAVEQTYAELFMYLDENRDGEIDKKPASCAKWDWGKTKTSQQGKVTKGGAVILAKHDRLYDANEDVEERTPIKMAWEGDDPIPDNWRAVLKVNPRDKIRVYRTRKANADQVLGQGSHESLNLDTDNAIRDKLNAREEVILWMEAVDYPESASKTDWLVNLELKFRQRKQSAQVCIAPWIMASDLDETKRLYIIDFKTGNFVADNKIKSLGVEIDNRTVIDELFTAAGDDKGQEVTEGLITKNRYLRDAMRFGTQSAPGVGLGRQSPGEQGRSICVVLRGNCTDTQTKVPYNGIDRKNDRIGVFAKGDEKGGVELQTGGNMVVSPAVEDYPWGRIICGSVEKAKDQNLGPWEGFLDAQCVQKPIKIDTSWLSVGHSDEIVSFLPAVNGSEAAGSKNFRMVMANPKHAYELLYKTGIHWEDVAAVMADWFAADRRFQNKWRKQKFFPPVDFRNVAESEEFTRHDKGEYRIAFFRFIDTHQCSQKWLTQFFSDELLNDQVQWAEGARQKLSEAHIAGLNEIWTDEFGALENQIKQYSEEEADAPPQENEDQPADQEGGDDEGGPPPPPLFDMPDEKEKAKKKTKKQWEVAGAIRKAINDLKGNWYSGLTDAQRNKILKPWFARHIRKLEETVDPKNAADAENKKKTRWLGLCYVAEFPEFKDLCTARVMLQAADEIEISANIPSLEDYVKTSQKLWKETELDALQMLEATNKAKSNPAHPTLNDLAAMIGENISMKSGNWENLVSRQKVNMVIAAKLDVIRDVLKEELKINDKDILEIPVLYTNMPDAKTFVADMVNFTLLNQPAGTVIPGDPGPKPSTGCLCFVPKPYGPIIGGKDIYEEDTKAQLEKLGIKVKFIDEWYEYHLNDGEMHCGTNQQPNAVVKKWWEQEKDPWR